MRRKHFNYLWLAGIALVLSAKVALSQNPDAPTTSAGYIPVLSGTFAYVQNTNRGVTSLDPQIETVWLVPCGSHVLLESRAEFTGFFQRQTQTSGPFVGKV